MDPNLDEIASVFKIPELKKSAAVPNTPMGLEVKPDPGFSFKTKREDKSIIYINICQSASIAEPGMKKKLDQQGNPVEGMNVPISIGAPRGIKTKGGKSCYVHDLIVNPQVVKDIFVDETGKYRDFVCQLAIQSINQKYQDTLSLQYKLLLKSKYVGEMEAQTIRHPSTVPTVEEISSDASPITVSPSPPVSRKVAPPIKLVYLLHLVQVPDYKDQSLHEINPINRVPFEVPNSGEEHVEPINPVTADEFTHIQLQCILDHTLSDLQATALPRLRISAYRLQVYTAHQGSETIHLNLFFPHTLLPESCRCQLRPASLKFTELNALVPLEKRNPALSPDPGSKPWLVQHALRGPDDDADGDLSSSEARASGSNLLSASPLSASMVSEDDELPEDRFHKRDASSSYIIAQREEGLRKVKSKDTFGESSQESAAPVPKSPLTNDADIRTTGAGNVTDEIAKLPLLSTRYLDAAATPAGDKVRVHYALIEPVLNPPRNGMSMFHFTSSCSHRPSTSGNFLQLCGCECCEFLSLKACTPVCWSYCFRRKWLTQYTFLSWTTRICFLFAEVAYLTHLGATQEEINNVLANVFNASC